MSETKNNCRNCKHHIISKETGLGTIIWCKENKVFEYVKFDCKQYETNSETNKNEISV